MRKPTKLDYYDLPDVDPPSRARNEALGRAVRAGQAARGRLLDPGLDLGPDECRDLARVAAEGALARTELILGNVPLAIDRGHRLAEKWRMEAADAVGYSMLGLIKGADGYDPERYGTAFSTHATWQVKGSVSHGRRACREYDPLPGGRAVFRGRGLGGKSDADDAPWSEPLAPEDPDVEERDDLRACQARVEELLARLGDRERRIVSARFGLGCPRQSLEAIGRDLGVTKERVRQIETKAMAKLRAAALVAGASVAQ